MIPEGKEALSFALGRKPIRKRTIERDF